MPSLKIDDLTIGRKYLVRYSMERYSMDRVAVMKFMGRDEGMHARNRDGFTVWDARPAFGAQTLPEDWIIEISAVPQGRECYVDRIAQP